MSESPETYASIALAVMTSQCFTLSLSRKFHLFLQRGMECFNSSCLQLSSTWPFFSEVSFYHSFKYLKLLRQRNSCFETQKFRDENGTFCEVCMCVFVVCICDKTRNIDQRTVIDKKSQGENLPIHKPISSRV